MTGNFSSQDSDRELRPARGGSDRMHPPTTRVTSWPRVSTHGVGRIEESVIGQTCRVALAGFAGLVARGVVPVQSPPTISASPLPRKP